MSERQIAQKASRPLEMELKVALDTDSGDDLPDVRSPKLEAALTKRIDGSRLSSRKVNVLVLNSDGTHSYGLNQTRDDLLAAARCDVGHFEEFYEQHWNGEHASPGAEPLRRGTGGGGGGVVSSRNYFGFGSPGLPTPPPLRRALTRSRRPGHHPTAAPRDIRKIMSDVTGVQSQSFMSRLGAVLLTFACPSYGTTRVAAPNSFEVLTTTQKIAAVVTVHRCTIIMPDGADSLLTSFTTKLRQSSDDADVSFLTFPRACLRLVVPFRLAPTQRGRVAVGTNTCTCALS